ncbi:MAG: hypothetical protein FJ134_15030 [Deltaproteobacteria bacterium]|nr:hypothetical protein [Deltaproteobacteria bacterium]
MVTKESLFPPVISSQPEGPGPGSPGGAGKEYGFRRKGKIEGPAPPEAEAPGDGALFGASTAAGPPKNRGKKVAAKADQDEDAKLRAECAKLEEEKKVPWEEIARSFPGESLDTVQG